jgi:hypothetical protein
MTAEGVDAIDGRDLIKYAGLKCCLQFGTSSLAMPPHALGRGTDTFEFPVRAYADCVSRVRRDFVNVRTQNGKLGRGIALLYEGSRCTANAGVDVIGAHDIRTLVGGNCCRQYFASAKERASAVPGSVRTRAAST